MAVAADDVKGYPGLDGQPLAYREVGDGRPLILLHGYFSTATTNWVKYGHAALLAERGFRVVMPDLRAHGDSARSHDPADYTPDILTDDALALVAHLGLTDYDVGGYSLGGRTVMRMLVRGATPRLAVVVGVGLDDVVDAIGRREHFRRILTHLGTFERGSADWHAEAFLKTVGGDPVALRLLLDTWVDTPLAEVSAITTPTAVIVGEGDERVDSARELAATLPTSTYTVIPGTHMSAVTKRDLGESIATALA
jgi:pimeloyl-ACP methyl ester carboxylesterase